MFVMGTALRGFLAYYRYEWAIQDIGGFAETVYLLNDLGENSKRKAVDLVRGIFQPGAIVDVAFQSEADPR